MRTPRPALEVGRHAPRARARARAGRDSARGRGPGSPSRRTARRGALRAGSRRAISTHSRPSPGAEKNSNEPSLARCGGETSENRCAWMLSRSPPAAGGASSDHGPGGRPDAACVVVLRRRRGQHGVCRGRKRPAERRFGRRAEVEVEQDQRVRQRTFGRHALARDLEQPRPIGHRGVAELLLGLVDEVRQIDVGRPCRAALRTSAEPRSASRSSPNVRASARGKPGARATSREAPTADRAASASKAARAATASSASALAGAIPCPGEPRRRDSGGQLRQAEPRQADGGRTGPRNRAREIVGGAARGGDDREWL